MTLTLDIVPTARGRLPLLGHLGSLLVRPLKFVRSLRKDGDLVRIYFGTRPVYFVTDVALLRELLVDHGSEFDKGSIFDEGKAFIGEGLITSAGELHRRQRRLIQPAFHRSRIEQYVPSMRDAALRVTGQWRSNQPVEMGEAMMRVAFVAITGVMFSGTMDPDAEERLLRNLHLLIRGALVRAVSPDFVARLPIRMNRAYPQTVAEVRGIVDDMLHTSMAAPGRPPDLVQLLQSARGPGAETGMSRQQLTDELVSIMIAGTETTGGALAWAMHEIATRPEIGERVRAEVDRVVGGREVTLSDIPELEYIRRVLNEVLRRRAAWLSTRRSLRTVELAGLSVPAGTEFAFSLYALHHDPDIYPDPDRFDVERWRPNVVRERPRGAFIPFLDGNRKCMGDSFAWTEMAIVVATIARSWHLHPMPGIRVRELPVATIRPSRLTIVPVARQ